jgi:FkbM family methyltransferase
MIIEIGTSDFNTDAGLQDGIFIEPVKYYFDRLPDCKKENVAISDYEGQIKIFYITDEEIENYNLPDWLRGCSSINEPHPTTLRYITKDKIRCDVVEVVKIKTILDKYNVTKIDFLKIDTEGHDCVILSNFLDESTILPTKIQIENNRLSDKDGILRLQERLSNLGYSYELIDRDIIFEKIIN